ncbi:uncharacterized protein LOC113503886 [Trichoplusia ni]|uniref:Uncharacterized protein LOC113503886 n=1 Tax=Trichoplusia ni TaxID=7111 RepID=A0A7E5WM64_TRINI|nr:uncharacterized protein LOC113503886 [Trichoplusia ni]XP_026741823.1 uncharacterized protein LOC113503886 [Trichoplusia ni]
MKRSEMPLPLLRRCGCISLQSGCYILCILSTLACLVNIAVGAWHLPRHWEREPEDNLISMSMVMFSSLSAISNLVALYGIIMRRPSKLQLSVVFNTVFIFCIFLVAIVTCLFRLDDFFKQPANIALVIFLLLSGAMYSIYYLAMINSLYRIMKMAYGEESAIPI